MTCSTSRSASCAVLAAALAAAGPGSAQAPVEATRIFSSDSLTTSFAQLSPNGRWLVMRIDNDTDGTSLWMAPTNGGPPFRLTSDGFADRGPVWFASGNRIGFESTRPNRDGGNRYYAMVLDIDAETGRPVGGPRQIGIEPSSRSGQPSPDGRWLPYVTLDAPLRLKIVPSSGGAARELARLESMPAGILFGPDSKYLYYQDAAGTAGAMRYTLRRVPVDGGPVEDVATAGHPLRILAGDPRFVLHGIGLPGQAVEWEVQRVDGTRIGTVRMPRGMRSPTLTADGLGLMGTDAYWTSSVRVASLDGGEPRVLVSGGQRWPEAWMPDGSALITDRRVGDDVVIDVLPLGGGTSQALRLPQGADMSGWQSSVGPWFSYRLPKASAAGGLEDDVYAVNVNTGATRVVASAAVRIGYRGRGGLEQDGARWIYIARDGTSGRLEVRTVDPAGGDSEMVRSFPADFVPTGPFSIHGDRIAYQVARGDSLDLMLTIGTAGEPRRLATFSKDADGLTWSWDGTRLAVADWLPGTPRHGGLWLLTFRPDGTPASPIRRFDLGIENGCDQFWWTPDDSYIAMLCYGAAGRIMKLRLADGQLSAVMPSETPQQIWEYYLSPDGRKVAYAAQSDAGSSVYVFDLKPLLRSTR